MNVYPETKILCLKKYGALASVVRVKNSIKYLANNLFFHVPNVREMIYNCSIEKKIGKQYKCI